MPTSWHLNKKNREVCLHQSKVTSSLDYIHGQVTKHSTVKWPIVFPIQSYTGIMDGAVPKLIEPIRKKCVI